MASVGVAPTPALIRSTGVLSRVEGERAARCCDLESVADSEVRVQVAAAGPVRLSLDADPVVVGAGRP